MAWLALLVLVAATAPLLPLPYPPYVPDLVHIAQAPLGPGRHWLGTDAQGRDVLSLLVFVLTGKLCGYEADWRC